MYLMNFKNFSESSVLLAGTTGVQATPRYIDMFIYLFYNGREMGMRMMIRFISSLLSCSWWRRILGCSGEEEAGNPRCRNKETSWLWYVRELSPHLHRERPHPSLCADLPSLWEIFSNCPWMLGLAIPTYHGKGTNPEAGKQNSPNTKPTLLPSRLWLDCSSQPSAMLDWVGPRVFSPLKSWCEKERGRVGSSNLGLTGSANSVLGAYQGVFFLENGVSCSCEDRVKKCWKSFLWLFENWSWCTHLVV